MSKETYSKPQGPTVRYAFQRNGIEHATAGANAWGIPSDVLNAMAPLKSDYEQKFSVANNKNTQSKASIAARDEAWDALAKPLYEMYDQHLVSNNLIAAADKLALNLHTAIGRGAIITPPAITTPIVVLMAEEVSVLHVVFTDSASASGSHAKPSGVAFCEIWGKIDGPAPTSPTDCPERFNIARSHESIAFNPVQRAKTMFGFARWVNKNGKAGVWGNVFSAIIP